MVEEADAPSPTVHLSSVLYWGGGGGGVGGHSALRGDSLP